jgi:energy-coupling factor transporter ATP-binding protein EcfA2
MARDLIVGSNFSGRSEALRAWLSAHGESFFLGPYAEAALSGLSSTVADEIAIYRGADGRRPVFATGVADAVAQKPATLSGGEQVLLALHCFSRSDYDRIGIDTALEQLDGENRARALDYLGAGGFDVALTDNRIEQALPGWSQGEGTGHTPGAFPLDLAAIVGGLKPRAAPVIAVKDLHFSYGRKDIFRGVDLTLAPGTAYRLLGRNGAGKTTFLKLLVGVLAPSRGALALDTMPYHPRRHGNTALALATQNPDHQWCGATLREDVTRRRKAFARYRDIAFPPDDALAILAMRLGARSLDDHLYELPLAARKRLSWLTPLCGALPWIVLDEPTVGQDRTTREALATAITGLGALGYGTLFVTHDDDFAARVPHTALRIGDGTIGSA